jgi:hypothetical protein
MFARLKDVPLYERPVPAVVVATPVHPRFVNAKTCPGVPVKSEVVVVAMVRTEGEAPMTEIGCDKESGPVAVSEVVAVEENEVGEVPVT